ncbi:MAG: hypothetical protein AB7G44_03500 [Bacteroidia bacterium]
MILSKALIIAYKLKHQLLPHCERIEIAGSIRRRKDEVGDIEIVCLPKKEILKNLFGWDEGIITNLLFSKEVNSLGKVIKGDTDGRMMQIELPEGIMLDLFMPEQHDYFRQFAIRTGSAEYAHKVIATGWIKLGWCGTKDGLRLQSECIKHDLPGGKVKWECRNTHPTLPPAWQSEEEFFTWLGVPFTPAQNRI